MIVSFIFSIFILVVNCNVSFAEDILFGNFTNIDVDKVWKVTFSKEVDPKTISNIRVALNGEYLDTIVNELSEDGKTVYVKNTEPYLYNNYYILDVSSSVRAKSGEYLGSYYYITFSTKSVDINDSERDWSEFNTGDDFIIYIDSISLKNGYDYVYVYAEEIFDMIEDFFNYDMNDKTTVYIDSLNKRQAYYSGYDHEFFINPFKLNGDIRYHFAHESVHAITNKKWGIGALAEGYDDTWLIEGIAEYVSKHYIDFPTCNSCGRLMDTGYGKEWYIERFNRRGIDVVRNVNSFKDLDATINDYYDYLAYESMVYFLVEKYGKDKFFNDFINNKVKYKTTPKTLEVTYGKSEKEIISEWKKFFNI